MHDIDRTQLEYGSELPGFEAERFDYESPWATESGAVLSEAEEYELASELLGVSSEEELDQFLGGLIKKVAQGAGKLFRGPVGQAVGGVLKGVAKKALPLAGGALDALGPLGAKIGSGVAAASGDTPAGGRRGGRGAVRRRQAVRPPRRRHGEEGGSRAGIGRPARGREVCRGQRGATAGPWPAEERRRWTHGGCEWPPAERPLGTPRQQHRALRCVRRASAP